ncbi:hypothetical protein EZV62_008304 [Acer yangbiense]|uniref:MLO-like protein n=1 Tax=Acer yangbiense TaxID=1000413 RepID=A0A5C7IDN9_9ROSI|nr:hypothetical protein EZV62_008304 [Acer yangbiense]
MGETGDQNSEEMRSLALTPTWSVATVLTVFVVVSLIVERSIHRLSNIVKWGLLCFVLWFASMLYGLGVGSFKVINAESFVSGSWAYSHSVVYLYALLRVDLKGVHMVFDYCLNRYTITVVEMSSDNCFVLLEMGELFGNSFGLVQAVPWLRKTNRKPLLSAVEKMKEELMLLGFISLLLTATSSTISNICIPSKFYDSTFAPCSRSEIDEETESNSSEGRKLLMSSLFPHAFRRTLNELNNLNKNTCKEGHEPFVSYEGLEQLHRFIFVMAVTHVSYSCLTMLLAVVKIHSWRAWEEQAHMDRSDSLTGELVNLLALLTSVLIVPFCGFKSFDGSLIEYTTICTAIVSCEIWVADSIITDADVTVQVTRQFFSVTEEARNMTIRRQTTFVRYHASIPVARNRLIIWVTCFFRQFGRSVVRADYLTLRNGFITNHNLTPKYDFHSYMIRSMEEEFQRIVGVSGPLWGFVVAFMLFNVKGSNLYFWIAIIPVTVSIFYLIFIYLFVLIYVLALVLLVGAKLQHVIATLALENAGITGFFHGTKLKPRDELFWFNKPELLLSLIHFVLFQWQFGYNSCFIHNHALVYVRLILGFAGQFLCSYSTLPLYALVTQMGTNYKAALIPQRIRETIHGWGKEARRKRRHGLYPDDSTIHTDTSTVMSLEEDEHQLIDIPETADHTVTDIELQPSNVTCPSPVADETSSRPLLRPSATISSSTLPLSFQTEGIPRSSSMPVRRE